jgi:hypothetical protein
VIFPEQVIKTNILKYVLLKDSPSPFFLERGEGGEVLTRFAFSKVNN